MPQVTPWLSCALGGSLGRQATLVVYDTTIDDERRTNTMGLLMSLKMLLGTHRGFDTTGADRTGWLRAAGSRDLRMSL